MMANIPCSAFTTRAEGICSSLRNNAILQANGYSKEVIALWDTGATCSCISETVVNELQLVPTGKLQIKTPSGTKTVNTYLVSVGLPNKVQITDLGVCDSDIDNQGIGMLIGMDIIKMGDFAVSNHEGKTVFTFRLPSQKVTDYVGQISLSNKIGTPHGVKTKRKNK